MTRRLKLTVAYDGTRYHGFQRQAGLITVQETLENGLARLFGHSISLSASGRTDTGVHALGQVVSFSAAGSIPLARIVPAARSALPPDVAVVAAEEAAADFHARRSAQAKQYIYKIAEKKIADPFLVNYAWLRPEEFYLDALNEASARLIGVHDFSSFRAAGSTPGQPVRTIEIAFWERTNGLLVFTVRGDGFLYRMVRNIVGTLLDVGRGKMTAAHFADVLAARDRRAAGSTAPPQGLYLNKVFYR